MEKLRQIVEGTDTPTGRWFDLTIQGLIVVSLLSFSFDTLPGLSEDTKRLLRTVEIVTVLIFTVEYILRIMVAEKPRRFVFSFFGVIDLLAILPFYLNLGLDLRAARVFRFLRLFRILKLLRYNQAISRFSRAFRAIKEELVLFFFSSFLLLFSASIGIYYCENTAQPDAFASIFDSLWWAVSTLATVGYGDIYPITPLGKVFTSLVLLIGLGIIAVPSGLMAAALTATKKDEQR